MKTSKYNIFFPYQDKKVAYNSLSDSFLVLEPLLHDLFIASVNENQVEALKEVHENLFDTLVKNGFIINDDFNELEEIKRISHETDFNEENFELTINPTMNCNFKCWYCYETHIKDSKMSEETLENICSLIDNILEQKKGELKNFNLQWFGGEPLLYFYKTVLPLLKWTYPKMVQNKINFVSGFTTNGLLINQELLDECLKYGVKHFQITLDGHRDRHNIVRYISNNKGSYDEIVSNIKLCLKNKAIVTARINVSEETIRDLYKIIEDFNDVSTEDKNYLTFSFHEVWQNEKRLVADISPIVDMYRQHGLKTGFIGESTASILNSCYADKLNHATVNYNGDVYKCTARDYNSSSREGVLENDGAITWNDKFNKRIYDTRFQNKPCLECKILPMCNGGCSQQRIEHIGVDYCVHNFDENSKLDVIKERFKTRMVIKVPKIYQDDAVNSLLNINFKSFEAHEPEVFQKSLDNFFANEVRQEIVGQIQKVNKYYSDALVSLRNNMLNDYENSFEQINSILSGLSLTPKEEKVASLFALPVTAYYEYKLGNYEAAINYTNESIKNDDFFLKDHPFLYGHKIQQMHNTMRVLFKANKIDEALRIGNMTLSHLITGSSLEPGVGLWYNSYEIEHNIEMIGMIYQIITETIRVITQISNNQQEEYDYFSLAFGSILSSELLESAPSDLLPVLKFLAFKMKRTLANSYMDYHSANLKDELLSTSYAYMCPPLIKSLFLSLNLDSYTESKKEFDKAYAYSEFVNGSAISTR